VPDSYLLDACVLYPVITRDLLLTLAADGAFHPIWTDEIIDEMRRNILADRPDIAVAKLERNMVAAMNRAFPKACSTGFEPLIADMDNDVKDRHVSAAAAYAGATGIVTYNLRDFQSAEIQRRNIRVISPAALVEEFMSEFPDVVGQAILTMSQRRTRPAMTPNEVVVAIARQQDFDDLTDRLLDLIG
jgi:hypothetical protein